MRMNNIAMKTKIERKKLLEKVKANARKHVEIVKEAREGYVKKARAALESRLKQVLKGQVVSLSFTLSPPQDYSAVYKNVVQMLEWNTNEYVELGPDEFRQIVLDEWDWHDNFLAANSHYSGQALSWMHEKAGGSLVQPDDMPVGSSDDSED